jgi:hypothetical protein
VRCYGQAVKAALMLCNAADVHNGLFYILGGGWTVAGPGIVGGMIAVKLEVPWSYLGEDVDWRLDLLDADEQPVLHPENEEPIAAYGQFRPEGAAIPHQPIDVSFIVPFGPLDLKPGGRYVWVLTMAGQTNDQWRAGFSMRKTPLNGAE